MAIGINDLDDDDVLDVQQVSQEEVLPQNQETEEQDFMSDFLKSKGIDDMSRIKFEGENNQIIERDWKDLSREEKFNILNTPLTQNEETSHEENNLSQEEAEFINLLRENGITPQQYIQSLTPQETGPNYKIDDLSDDEVFLLDLESRVGELNNDEAAQVLANAKQNEDFYKKQVDGIRKEYKEREDYASQQEQASIEEEQRQAFEEYQAKIVDSINEFNSIGNLDLNFEDKDKEELAEFMLSQDENGANYLYQALQDPETLTRAAWFILNGEEAFNNIADYFTNQIKLISENQYKKGLEDGRKGIQTRPTVVIDNSKNKTNHHSSIKTIDDLDDDN